MLEPKHRPIVLIVRDGWGANPHPEWNHANAVHLARTPVDDRLMAGYPHVLIHTSGNDVGLPDGVMGNSEVGHQNIGAGRIVDQEIMRITRRIKDGTFFENPGLVGAFERAGKTGGNVHIMGLCSDGRVHSDMDHLYALLEMAGKRGFPPDRVFVHAFTDGRDTVPDGGLGYIKAVEARCRQHGINPVASVIGRYYAMDRDNRWDRVETAYRMLTAGAGKRFATASDAIADYYEHPTERNRSGDEFVTPSLVAPDDASVTTIRDGDSVIFFNYRGDRPRELTRAFVLDEFPFDETGKDAARKKLGFERGAKLDLHYVTMSRYEQGLPVEIAFDKPPKLENILAAFIAEQGLSQFRSAETEKYAHVTFFFNDYRDEPFPGEQRRLVPSPRDVATYDLKPEMSAREIADVVCERIATGSDDLIVVNFANGDMVGHTGDLKAAIRAVETVDHCVGRVVDGAANRGGGLIVTADHGNCEQMIHPDTGGPHTAHTTYDVELIVVDERFQGHRLRTGGGLADIAPTLLDMLDLTKPSEMTGESLIITR